MGWFKHAFITKFNNIQPEVYLIYRSFMAKNILHSKRGTVFTGHTDQVSRRMGFAALPTSGLVIKIVRHCVELSGWPGVCLGFIGFLCLCALKLLISIHIFGKAHQYVEEENDVNECKDKLCNPIRHFEISSGKEVNGLPSTNSLRSGC